jgi:hypothetical protein
MSTGIETNGRTEKSPPAPASNGAPAPRSDPPRISAAERYKQSTRLCVFVPLHLVKRLEDHSAGEGMTRDALITDLIGWAMQYRYRKRDKSLRDAFGVDDIPDPN